MNEREVRKMLANPFYAIEIDESLCSPHEPIVSEDQWVMAALRAMRDHGPEAFLRDLLEALKNPVRS